MGYNKVGLLARNNKTRTFVDGVEVKGVTRLDVHRDTNSCKTEISIDFECDLDTAKQKNDRVVIDKCDYEELQKLAKPLQEWLLDHYSMLCAIRIDSERAAVVCDDISVPFSYDQ